MTRSFSLLLLLFLGAVALPSSAATVGFGSQANGVSGLSRATLDLGEASLAIEAWPQYGAASAVLDERGRAGLGVNSRTIPGVSGGELDKFDVITSLNPELDGRGESVTLTLDRPGYLSAIDFDGVKDEALEYFVLTTESGDRYEFFDSAANTTVAGAVDAAVNAGVVTGDVVYLLEDATFDDEIFGLTIPFAAGEVITITYAELGAQFGPIQSGNGARLQGLGFEFVPEPNTFSLAAVGGLGVRRRRRAAAV